MIRLLKGIANELWSVPGIIARNCLAYISILCLPQEYRHASGWKIFLLPGAKKAIPQFYQYSRHYFLEHIHKSPRVYLPHGKISNINAIRPYLKRLYDELAEKNILIGHSMGGIAALIALTEHPDRIQHVILIGCPVNLQKLRQPLARMLRMALGIDTASVKRFERMLTQIQADPNLLAKITIIASMGDLLFPPSSCHIRGAASHHAHSQPTHIALHMDAKVLDFMRSTITTTIGRQSVLIQKDELFQKA